MSGAVTIEELSIRSTSGATLLAPASMTVHRGSVTALTGPSGVGKSTLMRAVLGHLPAGARKSSGSVRVAGQDVFALDRTALQVFRRENVAYVSQDPGAALNPMMRVRALLRESAHADAATRPAEVLDRVGLSEHHLRRYPGELSGGEQRRVALAIALVREVGVLVVDEPLAGLHGRLRNSIADLLATLAAEDEVAVLVSGHDTEVLHRIADDVIALGGSAVGPSGPATPAPGTALPGPPVLQARAISATAGRRELLDSVDLDVTAAEMVAVVGPSGAGKTTLARVLAGLHTEASGNLLVRGHVLGLGRARRSRTDRKRVQLIPQNPLSTLNPKHTVLHTLARPLRLNGRTPRSEVTERASALLDSVELDRDLLRRYPDELSGGQRQRIAIARAIAVEPDILICDEITSALDSTTARAIMDLLGRVRTASGIGILVISHDMTLIAEHCARVLVLADGKVVEHGETSAVLADPSAPEIRALLA